MRFWRSVSPPQPQPQSLRRVQGPYIAAPTHTQLHMPGFVVGCFGSMILTPLRGTAHAAVAWAVAWFSAAAFVVGPAGRPASAQQNPSATSSSAANAAGTTVNNQSNSQINTNTFYGFGPGINCPTPTLSISGFGGSGSGSSAGNTVGASVNAGNYGGIVTFTLPVGGVNGEICKEIGRAQVKALMSQVNRTQMEASKTQADINLVTALKCVEIQRVAVLTGPFAAVCEGVYARGVLVPPTGAAPAPGMAPAPPRPSR